MALMIKMMATCPLSVISLLCISVSSKETKANYKSKELSTMVMNDSDLPSTLPCLMEKAILRR